VKTNTLHLHSPGVSTWGRRASSWHSISAGSDSECATQRADQRHRWSSAYRRRFEVYTTTNGGAEPISAKVHHSIRQASFPCLPGE